MKLKYKFQINENDNIDGEKLIKQILKNRGIEKIDEFLNPSHPNLIEISQFGFDKEVKKTMGILEQVKKSNTTIVVYTDYDADGITGGAILWETLHLLGFKTMPYVPHRQKEGYGFSVKGIDQIKKLYNPGLIISVDHGITAKEKITYAKSLNIPVIITDHHLKPELPPTDAEAVFHIPQLSGSGVAYVFSKEVFKYFQSQSSNKSLLENYFKCDYLALATIGTIADLVPLIGPSRSIVKYGLKAFEKTKRIGIKAILEEAAIKNKQITPYEVGYLIAPRINAIGRLTHSIDALRLLCTKDHNKAQQLAKKMGTTNRQRQDLVEESLKEAENKIKKMDKIPKLIVLQSESWHEGIIGLIASKIAETFFRPTIVITKADLPADGQAIIYKGSARSFPYLHITDFLRQFRKHLIDVGGHAGAAGFSIEKNKLNLFINKIQKEANKKIKDKDLRKTIIADIKIPLSKITLKLAQTLEKLEPFGIGNPQPTFLSVGTLIDTKIIGRNAKHLKLLIKPLLNHKILEFVSFNSAELFPHLYKNQKLTITYLIGVNQWNGKEEIKGIIKHIIPDP